ncbi:MAG: hypothetical protein ACXVEE_00980 [Polyangiales bacterium]
MRRLLLSSFAFLVACAGGSSEDIGGTTTDSSTPVDSSSPLDSGGELDGSDSTVDETATIDSSTDDGASGSESGDVGDAPPPWPSCDAQPTGTTAKTIAQIWTDDPAMPAFDWISGSIVTAVSQGACSAGKACQIFLQEGTGADLAAVSHHAIKLFISAKTADRFAGIAPGDKVDVAGYAVRYTLDGQNELLVEVNDLLRGCIKKTGTGTIAPVAATLDNLSTVSAYESTIGPVLVTLSNLSGKPSTPSAIFGLYPTTGGFDAGADGGTTGIVSLSPYFLTGGAFTGLTSGTKTDFTTITGVYGMFYPGTGDAGPATKYLVIYPRVMTEVVH